MGGGSTQIVHLADGAIARRTTRCSVGSSLLAAALSDPIDEDGWRALEARVGHAVDAAAGTTIGFDPDDALSVGGTARRLASIAGGRCARPRATPCSSARRSRRSSASCCATDAGAYARRHDDDPARVRMLAPGALLLGAILDRYGLACDPGQPAGACARASCSRPSPTPKAGGSTPATGPGPAAPSHRARLSGGLGRPARTPG